MDFQSEKSFGKLKLILCILKHVEDVKDRSNTPKGCNTSGGSRIFPRGGCEPSRGGMNTPNFPENCMKSKEFGCPGGGVRPSHPPLDPPMNTMYIEDVEDGKSAYTTHFCS